MEIRLMSQHFRFDASGSLTALERGNRIAVIEMSQTKWLVAALVPGVERQVKMFDAYEQMLVKFLHHWRRDGVWLVYWQRACRVEAYKVYPTSSAVSRGYRRAKTDYLDGELLMRVLREYLHALQARRAPVLVGR